MASPFDAAWNTDSFITANRLNKTTIGNGTTVEREAITTWQTDRLFFDTTKNNIYTNVGTESSINWKALVINTGFGNGSDGDITSSSYTSNSFTIAPFDGSTPKNVRQYNNITIPAGDTLNVGNLSTALFDSASAVSPKRWIIFVNGTLTINGTLNLEGRGGRGATTVGQGGAGGAETTNSVDNDGAAGTDGSSGGAGYKKTASTGNSVSGVDGGTGGRGGSTIKYVFGNPSAPDFGGDAGLKGDTGTVITKRTEGDLNLTDFEIFQTVFNGNLAQWGAGGSSGGGGSGGGSGNVGGASSGSGGSVSGTGGAGGDGGNGGVGGSGGGSVVIIAFNIIFGTSGSINANGIGGGLGLAGDDSPDISRGYGQSGHTVTPTSETITGASGGASNGANGAGGTGGVFVTVDSQPDSRGQPSSTGGGGAAGGNGANGDGGFVALISTSVISTADKAKVTVIAGTGGNSGTVGNKVFLQI